MKRQIYKLEGATVNNYSLVTEEDLFLVVDESIDYALQSDVDLILYPDTVLKTTPVTITGLTASFDATAFQWRLNAVSYLNTPAFSQLIDAASTGFRRGDVIVGDDTPQAIYIKNTEESDISITYPEIPDGMIALAYLPIFGDTLEPALPPVIDPTIPKKVSDTIYGSGYMSLVNGRINDEFFRVNYNQYVGVDASAEVATGGVGNAPIYIRQYSSEEVDEEIDPFYEVVNEVTLLDETGATLLNELYINGEKIYANIIEKTFAELNSLIAANALVVGQCYLLTDYMTTYTQPITWLFKTSGVIEPLILTAVTVNSFHAVARSTLHPQDVVFYSIDDSTEGFTKGKIFRRIDTERNNDIGTDWRYVKYSRGGVDKLLFENYSGCRDNKISQTSLHNNVSGHSLVGLTLGIESTANTFGNEVANCTFISNFSGNTVADSTANNIFSVADLPLYTGAGQVLLVLDALRPLSGAEVVGGGSEQVQVFKNTLGKWICLSGSLMSVVKISGTYTLTDADNGKILLLTASCTVTFPNTLKRGFNCLFQTATGAVMTRSLGVGVTMPWAVGTSLPDKSSFSLVNTDTVNEYLTNGL